MKRRAEMVARLMRRREELEERRRLRRAEVAFIVQARRRRGRRVRLWSPAGPPLMVAGFTDKRDRAEVARRGAWARIRDGVGGLLGMLAGLLAIRRPRRLQERGA